MLVIRLDDFDLILGIDFMQKNPIVPMPHPDGAMVMSEARPYFCSMCTSLCKGREEIESGDF